MAAGGVSVAVAAGAELSVAGFAGRSAAGGEVTAGETTPDDAETALARFSASWAKLLSPPLPRCPPPWGLGAERDCGEAGMADSDDGCVGSVDIANERWLSGEIPASKSGVTVRLPRHLPSVTQAEKTG